ncbi:MAG: helix-turn-helix domain-containing protein [PVC group bacterium]
MKAATILVIEDEPTILTGLTDLLEREGEAINRFDFLDEIWGMSYEGTTRTLDQHIVQLRKKIEDKPAQPRHILTVHGVGYRFIGTPD